MTPWSTHSQLPLDPLHISSRMFLSGQKPVLAVAVVVFKDILFCKAFFLRCHRIVIGLQLICIVALNLEGLSFRDNPSVPPP